MLTKKQLKILEVFTEDVFGEYTYKDLKKKSKEKSNNTLQLAIRAFKKGDLVNEKRYGKTRIFSINHDNDIVYLYLNHIFLQKMPDIIRNFIRRLNKEIQKHTTFYSLIIFGSYADSTYTDKSDLDIAVIVQDKEDEKHIHRIIRWAKLKSVQDLDAHAITEADFTEMLENEEANLGKMIAAKNLPVYNLNSFFGLIKNVIDKGIRLQTLSVEV